MKKITHTSDFDAKTMLQEAGFRATNARIGVLEYLEGSFKPVNAKTIFEALGKKKAIDKVTVYRILNSFVEARIVRHIDFRHGHALYEITTRKHHHHIICEECKKIAHIDCDLSELQKGAKKSAGFATIRDHALEFFGVCNNCYRQ